MSLVLLFILFLIFFKFKFLFFKKFILLYVILYFFNEFFFFFMFIIFFKVLYGLLVIDKILFFGLIIFCIYKVSVCVLFIIIGFIRVFFVLNILE